MEGLGLRLEALLAIPLCSVLGLLTSLSVDGVPFGPYFVRATPCGVLTGGTGFFFSSPGPPKKVSLPARGSGGGGGCGACCGALSYC